MVRQEVERIMREQGRGGDLFLSKVKTTSPYSGRAVAVIPALSQTPKGYDGLNLTLANNLRADLQRQRDLIVIPEGRHQRGPSQTRGRQGSHQPEHSGFGQCPGGPGGHHHSDHPAGL